MAWLGLVVVVAAGAMARAEAATIDDRYAAPRARFEQVLAAQAAGNHRRAAELAGGLEEYPLYPYYLYDDLRRRLHHFPQAEVQRFLTTYDNSYLAGRLRNEYLAKLAHAQRWTEFLEFYRPSDDIAMRCRQLTARIRSGIPEGVLDDSRAIWLSGASLPDTCDAAFERLYASDLMDDTLLWQRVRLAMDAGNPSLARYLAGRLDGARYRNLHALWARARADPDRALTEKGLADDAETREILVYAITRLARTQVDRAERAWATLSTRFGFVAAESGAVARAIAVAAAGSNHPRRIGLLDAVPDDAVDDAVERYRVREGIAERAWSELARWTAAPPRFGVNPLRWRYWRARALELTGRDAAARLLYTELARERDYYGFLAADKLGQAYVFSHKPVAATSAEISAVLAIPGIPRAHELYRIGRGIQARREWYFELGRMQRRQLEVAASIAADWAWFNQAIFALGRAESYDDLELRFPIIHADIAADYAVRRHLDPARIMAIIRSESAFAPDARSPAGALGLMQLMPATARETGRRIGIKLPRLEKLSDPRTNIALGSAYLAQMIARFGGNFAMAAAAYNAGPNRVRQWQGTRCIPADIWIDTIPFTETRRYVRRAFFYAAVYEWRLARAITPLTSVMPAIPGHGSNEVTDCRT